LLVGPRELFSIAFAMLEAFDSHGLFENGVIALLSILGLLSTVLGIPTGQQNHHLESILLLFEDL
jgi:hypothetical protein